ncbi:MAG: GNAT family N-acetyltransferase [[Eubacterium] siraeum]
MAEPATARQNAIYDCTHIYLDAFDKKGPIGDLYSKAVAEYLERFIKTENCFMYTSIEKDVILGFLTACEIPGILSRNIKIDTVAIAPEYQNNGYGTVMMNEFFNLFENAVFSLEQKETAFRISRTAKSDSKR